MAKFSLSKFNELNEKAKEQKDFGNPPPRGHYIAEVMQIGFKKSNGELEDGTPKKGERFGIGFQIDPDDATAPSQYVWYNQTIVNNDGEDNEIGQISMAKMLETLAEGQFDAAAFCNDSETEVQKFVGTKCKIFINPKKGKNDFWDMKLKVESVLENKYASVKPETEKEDVSSPVEDNAEEVDVQVGMRVAFDWKDGNQYAAKISSFAEMGDKQFIMLEPEQPKQKDGKMFPTPLGVEAHQVSAILPDSSPEIVDDEELIEDEEEQKVSPIVKGSKVSYPWQGKTLNGEVYSIDEDEGTLKVIAVIDGTKKARKVKIEEVIPF